MSPLLRSERGGLDRTESVLAWGPSAQGLRDTNTWPQSDRARCSASRGQEVQPCPRRRDRKSSRVPGGGTGSPAMSQEAGQEVQPCPRRQEMPPQKTVDQQRFNKMHPRLSGKSKWGRSVPTERGQTGVIMAGLEEG